MVCQQRLATLGTDCYSSKQGMDAPEPGKPHLKTHPRIHITIMLDEKLNLDQPTVDHCPPLTIAGGSDLGARNPAHSELVPNQLNGIQSPLTRVRLANLIHVAPSASRGTH